MIDRYVRLVGLFLLRAGRQPAFSFLLTLAVLSCLAGANQAAAEEWPFWRGPRGDGSSSEVEVPTNWNGTTGENIAWQVDVPGKGHSSPIVWGDRVFLTTCTPEDQRRLLLCFDRQTGKTLWQTEVISAELEINHRLNSHASGTPATDGERVYVSFFEPSGTKDKDPVETNRDRSQGSMVVAAYDFDGKEVWKVRPGSFASLHGFCSNPILYRDLVIVNGDHDGDAYLVGLNKKTGQTVWKTPRENKKRSYTTPIIRTIDGREQMILSGSICVASYDPNTGRRHWIIDGPTDQFVASVVYGKGLVFVTAGFPERHMMAIRPNGTGNVTESHIVWRTRNACAYVPSPAAVGDYFVVVTDRGVGSCFQADSGQRHWKERIGTESFSSSPVVIAGLVYFLDEAGTTHVVRPGKKLDIVAENPLGEACYASPAVSNGQIFIRSESRLWCIGK